MSDKHLERKEVLNLVYTRQADRMADAYASLKAEVERLTDCKAQADRFKAEVERLTDAIMRGASIPDAKPIDSNQSTRWQD